jgi:hypothetical protein
MLDGHLDQPSLREAYRLETARHGEGIPVRSQDGQRTNAGHGARPYQYTAVPKVLTVRSTYSRSPANIEVSSFTSFSSRCEVLHSQRRCSGDRNPFLDRRRPLLCQNPGFSCDASVRAVQTHHRRPAAAGRVVRLGAKRRCTCLGGDLRLRVEDSCCR